MISVIVPARNAAATIDGQLDALAGQEYDGDWELIVADNGSTDGTADLVRAAAARFSKLRVVPAPDGPGINVARNAGARAARGRFLLFCDADDVVAPGWMAAMARAADTCDAVGGRVDRATLNDPEIVAARNMDQDFTELPPIAGFLPRPPGSNCGVRADLWRELGGFDERWSVGATETEFFWRLQLAGHRVCYVPDAVVQYRYRPDLASHARQFYRFGVARTRLYREFRDRGMPRSQWLRVGRELGRLTLHLPDVVRGRTRRWRWVTRAAAQWGRIVGSAKHRVLYL